MISHFQHVLHFVQKNHKKKEKIHTKNEKKKLILKFTKMQMGIHRT